MESIGQVLKDFRKEHGMTQKDLSRDICSQSVLSRIENNEEIPNILVMQQLCQRLGITIDQLMVDFLPKELLLRKYFQKMYFLMRHQRFAEIRAILNYLEEKRRIVLDKDLQQFYYFKAVCAFYLDNNPKQALDNARKGLDISVSKKYQGYFDSKILLMAFAAKMNDRLEKNEEADRLYNKSIELFETTMCDYTEKIELSELFLDYALFLLGRNEYQQADKIIDLGLRWNQQQASCYKLNELLTLKMTILKMIGEDKDSQRYREWLNATTKLRDFF
ncbi:helix-turn-helix domain-containing protein [Candidatus Enterococcus ferrettii]|uniref:HTH cro/C1-type domain-containing protein n=1 Tax=Candidatus Enterococcus ferrettii TaxID=2815324 RepID=A0ABV0ESM8_9ENTE|nr:helix-turn-helix transcriptional regulator [Enterococcus sp. 665A]MBO1340647.1 helix-turn-helix transcriptional regulator [Enterococcus sp. 665A]